MSDLDAALFGSGTPELASRDTGGDDYGSVHTGFSGGGGGSTAGPHGAASAAPSGNRRITAAGSNFLSQAKAWK